MNTRITEAQLLEALKQTCGGCANCCIEPVVPVTDANVRRLMKSTGLPAHRIVRMWSSEEMEWEEGREGRVLLSYGWRIMGLREPAGGRCLFLTADNRCREYGSRPMTCRTFPFEVELDGRGSFDDIGLHDEIGCRRRDGESMAPGRLLALARQELAEDDAFYVLLREWNARMMAACAAGSARGGKLDFLRFLGFGQKPCSLTNRKYSMLQRRVL